VQRARLLAKGTRPTPPPWRAPRSTRALLTRTLLTGTLLGVFGCLQALDLDDYSFPAEGAAGAGAVGADDPRWPSVSGRPPGFIIAAAGAGGVPSNPADTPSGASVAPDPRPPDDPRDSGTPPLDADAGDAGPDPDPAPACALSDRCVPPVPTGWQGPLVLGLNANDCPPTYPVALGVINTGLQEGGTSCTCACDIRTRSCFWTPLDAPPPASCASPSSALECFTVASSATCAARPTGDIAPSSWQYSKLACGQPAATGECGVGSCYPSAKEFGPLCIATTGEVSCPAEFPSAGLYHRGISDSRSCGGSCSCSVVDMSCTLDVTVCRSFGLQEPTSIASGNTLCLDVGDGVDIVPGGGTMGEGTCLAEGAVVSGSVAPIDPVTVCCLE
jgi:hypothetical protein